MDVRDYFAGQALNALIKDGQEDMKGKSIKKLTSLAFQIADAMLDTREQPSHPVVLAELPAPDRPRDSEPDVADKKNKKGKKSSGKDGSSSS